MMTAMALRCSAVLLCSSLLLRAAAMATDGWEEKVNDEGRKVQSMQISAPSMTEEDQYGYVMPDRYRCDSCKVVVHHLNEALTHRQLKSRRLHESEYHELFDETCATSFQGYGITLVNGENALSGPALKREDAVAPGSGSIQMGGETWEKRLRELCRQFVYDKVGEDELYEHFYSGGAVSAELCSSQTHDCQGPRKVLRKPEGKSSKKAKREKKHEETKETKAPQSSEKSTKERQREAREKKLNADIAAQKEMSKTEENIASDDEIRSILQGRKEAATISPNALLDANAFLAKLAAEHGHLAEEYTKKRTSKEWEQLLVKAAGRIYEQATVRV